MRKLEDPMISRANLSDWENGLDLRLHAEYPTLPQNAITSLPEWKYWRNAITAYDARSKAEKARDEELDEWLRQCILWSLWGALAVGITRWVLRSRAGLPNADTPVV